MNPRYLTRSTACAAIVCIAFAGVQLHASQRPAEQHPGQARALGARWLVANQSPDGGWGAGGFGSRGLGSASDVATTSLSVMALQRDALGSDAHREAIERGIEFIVRAVEASPQQGPRLQGPDGTQPQYKLGRNVDTHFAALLLGETGPDLPASLRERANRAYDKVLSKVVAAQQTDGSFDQDGWAPVLSSSVAAQSLYKAYENGKQIDREVLERSDDYQRKLVDTKTGRFDASAGAGVDLYAAATSLRGNSQAAKRPGAGEREFAARAAETTADAVRNDASRLIAGFGSVGGEEMLSYMMISDTLAEQDDDDWKRWETRIGAHLAATQNQDGSWSGHHCITSTPFVTAAAVMTLGSGAASQHALAVTPSR